MAFQLAALLSKFASSYSARNQDGGFTMRSNRYINTVAAPISWHPHVNLSNLWKFLQVIIDFTIKLSAEGMLLRISKAALHPHNEN